AKYAVNWLQVGKSTPIDRYNSFFEKFFSNSVRKKNVLQLNDSVLSNSFIRETLIYNMCTFVEYIQGAKLPNDKIFMFSSKTQFTLKPFLLDNTPLIKNENINIGLCLTDNNISLLFSNNILYDKSNKFDFNLLRPELL